MPRYRPRTQMPNLRGVYAIVSPSGKCYVGSSRNMRTRVGAHQRLLSNGNHHSRALQDAYNKYGALTFVVIEPVPSGDLIRFEQYWIDTLKPRYNGMPNATRAGSTASEETRCRLSESHRGYKMPIEQRQKIGDANRGQKRTPGLFKGRVFTDSHRNNLSLAMARRWRSGNVTPMKATQESLAINARIIAEYPLRGRALASDLSISVAALHRRASRLGVKCEVGQVNSWCTRRANLATHQVNDGG